MKHGHSIFTPHAHARAGGYVIGAGVHICDRIWENQPVSEFFIALLPFTSSEDAAVQI